VVLLTLIERELAEKRTLQKDLAELGARRKAVDRTVEELAALEENFRLLQLEAESLIQRSLFEVAPVDARLEDVDRVRFDARDWERHARIRALRALRKDQRPGHVRYRGMLVRPVAGPIIPGTGPDRPGVYFSGAPDDPVRAPEAGTVRFVGPLEGFGLVVVIEHEHGIHSIVGRLTSPFVKAGEPVRRAQTIARVPPLAGSSVPIYLELRQGREALDPRLWLKKNE
jgi:septal ring factor EnvC (AmiA/AmiB activator)